MSEIKELTVAQLRRRYDPSSFKFKDTRELKELKEQLGQDRAIEAIRFGIGVRHQGFNLFDGDPIFSLYVGKADVI